MRKWVMQLHIYGGLFFFGFLIVFALSSLLLNHKPLFLWQGSTTSAWDQPLSGISQYADPWKRAAIVQDQVGVGGRVLHPVITKAGDLNFDVARPGRRYTMHVTGNSAHIDEYRAGLVETLTEMHGVRPTNNSIWLNLWAWYQIIGALALVGSAITGVFLWAIRPRERIVGWTLLASATAASLLFILYIRAKG